MGGVAGCRENRIPPGPPHAAVPFTRHSAAPAQEQAVGPTLVPCQLTAQDGSRQRL